MSKLVINIPDYVKEQADAGKAEELGIPLWLAYEIANATPLQTGRWIDKDEKSAVCSCCNRNNTLYGDFCKWCGAKMVEPQESESKRYAELAKHYVQGLRAGLAESENEE